MSTGLSERLPDTAAQVFAALGEPHRLQMVARLSQGEPLSITRLASGAPITRQAVTKHLRVLEQAGIARPEKRGREQLWRVDPARLAEARRCLDLIGQQWDQALGRLKDLVETKAD